MKYTLIETEFDNDTRSFWFSKTDNKFLHNIDTFYYSVKLAHDFTSDSNDERVKAFRRYMRKYDTLDFDSCLEFSLPGAADQLNIMPFKFAGFYKYCVECPEQYDIFIAETVPHGQDGKSVTSEIIVQIRSYLLWTIGTTKAFEKSYESVKALCRKFNFDIAEVKENRVDYCWHSNYLQNPSRFFRIDNFTEMQVSRFKRVSYEYQLKPNDEYENDYISLGKRSDKCFVRIYLKSKEVVEKGYKAWFFKTWYFNKLISRYDLYLYEEMFQIKNWNYLPYARLKFYLEYGHDAVYKDTIKKVLDNPEIMSIESVIKLARQLTPEITLITNVEFQTTRKSSKSYVIKELKDNSKYKESKRIYDYLDNRRLITEYLTHSTLRLVRRDGDTNKSRCDYCEFWKALRSCKQIDCLSVPKYLKLVREYNRNLNKEVVKKRMLSAAITFSLYAKGINNDDVVDDCAAALIRLNDNDIESMKRYKKKKKKLLNSEDLIDMIDDDREFMWYLINQEGVLYEENTE